MPVAEQYLDSAGKGGFMVSSVGKKVVMAITGVALFGFVTVHMLGNMQAYMGREPMNHYAEFLQTMLHGAGIGAADGDGVLPDDVSLVPVGVVAGVHDDDGLL